jgi:Ran GTPase-activating protein (RanGAP) involved in mRNA processing and transport
LSPFSNIANKINDSLLFLQAMLLSSSSTNVSLTIVVAHWSWTSSSMNTPSQQTVTGLVSPTPLASLSSLNTHTHNHSLSAFPLTNPLSPSYLLVYIVGDIEQNFDQAVTRAIADTFPFRNRGCNLELKSCNIQAGGANSLANLLQSKSSSVVCLSLEWNSIGLFNHGINSLSTSLEYNQHLTSLDLRNNDIGTAGGCALAHALRKNSTLQTLDLRWNKIEDMGGEALVETFQLSQGLRDLHLAGNRLSTDLIGKLSAIKERREKSFQLLDTTRADVMDDGTEPANAVDAGPRDFDEAQWRVDLETRLREQFEERELEIVSDSKGEADAMKLELAASARQVTQLESQVQERDERLDGKCQEIAALETTQQGLKDRLLGAQEALKDEKRNGERSMEALR